MDCPYCHRPMHQKNYKLSGIEYHVCLNPNCLQENSDMELIDLFTAVDDFAEAMKHKLAHKRAEGYAGWRTIDVQESFISRIRKYIEGDKTQIIDIANYAMMIWYQSQHH
jgi:hypothetical protein